MSVPNCRRRLARGRQRLPSLDIQAGIIRSWPLNPAPPRAFITCPPCPFPTPAVILAHIREYGPAELADIARVYSRCGLNPPAPAAEPAAASQDGGGFEGSASSGSPLGDGDAAQDGGSSGGATLFDALARQTVACIQGADLQDILRCAAAAAAAPLPALLPSSLPGSGGERKMHSMQLAHLFSGALSPLIEPSGMQVAPWHAKAPGLPPPNHPCIAGS